MVGISTSKTKWKNLVYLVWGRLIAAQVENWKLIIWKIFKFLFLTFTYSDYPIKWFDSRSILLFIYISYQCVDITGSEIDTLYITLFPSLCRLSLCVWFHMIVLAILACIQRTSWRLYTRWLRSQQRIVEVTIAVCSTNYNWYLKSKYTKKFVSPFYLLFYVAENDYKFFSAPVCELCPHSVSLLSSMLRDLSVVLLLMFVFLTCTALFQC